MHDVLIQNSLTRKTDKIVPIENNEVKIYCCGPTVYNYAHIGNLRTYVFEDILVKTLKAAGYKVKHVMNITDVGHLTGDGDDGDDKMLLAAEKEHAGVLDIARKYEKIFFEHTHALGLARPDVVCRATEHVQEMIDFVKGLEEKGYAYFAGGNVYFDTSKFKDYGKLSGQKREDLRHGARVDQDTNKRNPSDFVLWFTTSKFENQILQWDSPWGRGYPGWHIECSAMAMKYLGDRVDIHCGGIDHIPVHHENEIAQSEGYLGHHWVNNWVHSEFLQVKDGKMSKSAGNFLTLDVLTEKGYRPEHYKYFCLGAHYKSQLLFSFDSMDAAKSAYENLLKKIALWKESQQQPDAAAQKVSQAKLSEYINNFDNFMFDDLKTPQALSVVWTLVKDNDVVNADKLKFIEHIDAVFSLNLLTNKPEEQDVEITPEVSAILEERRQARLNKNWAKSDELRDKLKAMGYGIKDIAGNEVEITKL